MDYLISFQEVNKTTKINICKESRKDFFLKLSKPKFLNSNIKKDLDPHIDDILMENEKELIQILKIKNEFLKEISK